MDWDGALLTAVASAVTALGGLVVAWAAVVSAKRRASEECELKLFAARREAEQCAAQLHELRMAR